MWSLEHDHDSRIRRPQYRRAPGLRRHHFRPGLEGLEGRTVLSSYTAATVSDLIADINASNNGGGSNTIKLVAGNTFSLTAVNNTTDGATGLPVIAANDRLTIAGNSDTIDLASGTPAFRLLDVAAGASLTLQKLTLQGGVEVDNGAQAAGGAIYSQGTLDLNFRQHCTGRQRRQRRLLLQSGRQWRQRVRRRAMRGRWHCDAAQRHCDEQFLLWRGRRQRLPQWKWEHGPGRGRRPLCWNPRHCVPRHLYSGERDQQHRLHQRPEHSRDLAWHLTKATVASPPPGPPGGKGRFRSTADRH
jgi:hypothetical protein